MWSEELTFILKLFADKLQRKRRVNIMSLELTTNIARHKLVNKIVVCSTVTIDVSVGFEPKITIFMSFGK